MKHYMNLFWTLLAWTLLVLAVSLLGTPDAQARPPHHSDTTVIVQVQDTRQASTDKREVLTGTAASLASAGLKYRYKKSLQFGAGYGYADGIHGFAFGATGSASNSMVSGSFVIEPALLDQEQFIGGNVGVTW